MIWSNMDSTDKTFCFLGFLLAVTLLIAYHISCNYDIAMAKQGLVQQRDNNVTIWVKPRAEK